MLGGVALNALGNTSCLCSFQSTKSYEPQVLDAYIWFIAIYVITHYFAAAVFVNGEIVELVLL